METQNVFGELLGIADPDPKLSIHADLYVCSTVYKYNVKIPLLTVKYYNS
jgi:hypothetical protein